MEVNDESRYQHELQTEEISPALMSSAFAGWPKSEASMSYSSHSRVGQQPTFMLARRIRMNEAEGAGRCRPAAPRFEA